jgi:tripartite-type tricarboxylate transporter receptor subunit TctC
MIRKIAGLALALFASVALAQDYPNKPIRIIVPYPAGGVADMATRAVTPRMAEILGQPIVVENQPAAGGVPATNALAKAAPDGYTLGSMFDSFATNPFLYKGVTHDPVKDFAPISLMVRSPQLLVVHPSTGIRTIDELILRGKEKNKVFFSTPGAGTSSRLSAELLKQSAGMDITLVSYRGGAPALNDLLGGQVTGMIASMGLVLQHVQAGKLVALGVSSPVRNPQAPNVAPIADRLSGFDAQSWTGMVAPAGTPQPVIDKLHDALTRALNAPEVRAKLGEQGFEIVGSTPPVFGAWVARENARWGKIIKDQNVTLE